jgi:hypothetical protein
MHLRTLLFEKMGEKRCNLVNAILGDVGKYSDDGNVALCFPQEISFQQE